jgi:DNA replication protein DnaC
VSDLIRTVRQSWSKSAAKTETQILDEICGVDLLILDEVGVQYGSDSEQITIFEIINRRYNDCKPMIVLSNLGLTAEDGKKTLRDYLGDRAFDRLREGGGKAIRFSWGSFRGQEQAF